MQDVMIKAFNEHGFDVFINNEDINCSNMRNTKYVKISQKGSGLSYITEDIKSQYYVMTNNVDAYVSHIENEFDKYNVNVTADYDDIENHISVQLRNKVDCIWDSNASKSFGDLIIVPVFEINDAEIVITSKLLDAWDKSLNEILAKGYENVANELYFKERPESNLYGMGLENHKFGAIAPLINFKWFEVLRKDGSDAIISFPNIVEATVANLTHGIMQSKEAEIYKSWYDYLLFLVRESNMIFSFCVGVYDCETDTVTFGDDKYTVSDLKEMFGAE